MQCGTKPMSLHLMLGGGGGFGFPPQREGLGGECPPSTMQAISSTPVEHNAIDGITATGTKITSPNGGVWGGSSPPAQCTSAKTKPIQSQPKMLISRWTSATNCEFANCVLRSIGNNFGDYLGAISETAWRPCRAILRPSYGHPGDILGSLKPS